MIDFLKFFSNKDVMPANIFIVGVLILFLVILPCFDRIFERQQCRDYAELMGVEYVYKKRIGCFVKKENKWKLVNFEKLSEAE